MVVYEFNYIIGLRSTSKLLVSEIYIFRDSKLVVNQVTKMFEARVTKMAKYLAMAKTLLVQFWAIKINQVGRDLNSHVDALTDLALAFEWENVWIIAMDLVVVPSYEIRQKSILSNTEIGPSHDKLS